MSSEVLLFVAMGNKSMLLKLVYMRAPTQQVVEKLGCVDTLGLGRPSSMGVSTKGNTKR